MDKNKMLIKNTIIIGIGQFVPKLLSFITLPLITLYLTTAEYGRYDYFISLASIIIPIVTLQIQQASFRYIISSKDTNEVSKYFTNSLIYTIISSTFLLPLTILLLPVQNVMMSTLLFLLYLSQSIHGLLAQVARGLAQNKQYSISIALFSIINFCCIIIFYFFKSITLELLISSLITSYVISLLYLIRYVKLSLYFNPELITFKTISLLLKYSIPLIPSTISLWIVNLSDRLIILNILGADANGIYAVANKIPSIFIMAYSIFNLAWTEIASRVSDEGEESSEYYSSLFHMLYKFLIGSMLFLISVTPILFNLLINAQYSEAYYQIPILYLGSFLSSIVLFYGGIYIAIKKTEQVGMTSTIGALLNLIINLVLIKKIGLYAASISTVCSYLIILIYRTIDLRKYLDIKYNRKELVISTILMATSITVLYYRNTFAILINLIISTIYNIIFNKILIVASYNKLKLLLRQNKGGYYE